MVMIKKERIVPPEICRPRLRGIKDTMDIVSGKWKFHILGILLSGGKMRFMDLLREIDGIASKMLSKELQDMEMNMLIKRTVVNTKPLTVEYEITDYGKTLEGIINEIARWGIEHRKTLSTKL
jgi:DNA-binding HxlR family transcriptional regulator